ncbi:archaemetzincin-1 [Anarhichas minor]|uniref:archaemetzincin-1 n=1 Tax=Anarhichas minor TaxID=65739 RepID=UPI003F73357C
MLFQGDLLQFLWNRKPKDAFCIVGITMIDLYPKDSWNFVFGDASLSMGMGVFSFARYDDNFYSQSYAGRLKKRLQTTLCLTDITLPPSPAPCCCVPARPYCTGWRGIRVKRLDQRRPLPVSLCPTSPNPLKPFRHPDCGATAMTLLCDMCIQSMENHPCVGI